MESTKSLYKLINGLRYFGVGTRVTRSIYKFPETYWVITRVKLSPDQNHGKVYGRLVWRGKAKDQDVQIPSTLKKQWSLLGMPDYKVFTASPSEVDSFIPKNQERTV